MGSHEIFIIFNYSASINKKPPNGGFFIHDQSGLATLAL
jgi:hypothetical protein